MDNQTFFSYCSCWKVQIDYTPHNLKHPFLSKPHGNITAVLLLILYMGVRFIVKKVIKHIFCVFSAYLKIDKMKRFSGSLFGPKILWFGTVSKFIKIEVHFLLKRKRELKIIE